MVAWLHCFGTHGSTDHHGRVRRQNQGMRKKTERAEVLPLPDAATLEAKFHNDLWGILRIQTATTNPEPRTENGGLKTHSIQ